MSRWGLRRRPAGLEITSSHVRAVHVPASGSPRAGEIELPPGAIDDGRVEDVDAVSDAIRRLWAQVGIPTRQVALGLSSHDIVTRQIELPDLSDRDLDSAARYELTDMIPFPITETVVDVQRVERFTDGDDVPWARVLVVAGFAPTLRQHVALVRQAGLRVRSLDLAPFALVRAAALQTSLEGVVALIELDQGGVTVVVVSDGVVRFTRAVETAARHATGQELEAELVLIEQYRRRAVGGDSVATGGRVDPILETIRGSLEYYSLQPGAPSIDRVLIAGDPTRLSTLGADLASLLTVPVQTIDPLTGVRADGAVPMAPSSTFGAALGLTLDSPGGLQGPRPLDLLPGRATSSGPGSLVVRGVAAAVVTGAALAGLTVAMGPDVGAARDQVAAAEAVLVQRQGELTRSRDAADAVRDLERRADRARAASRSRADWNRLIGAVRAATPPGSTVLAIAGTGPSTTRAGQPQPGKIEIVAQAADLSAAALWLERLATVPGLSDPWLSNASAGRSATGLVNFTLTAQLDDDAIILPEVPR
jgi:type IV pilus assembly protein PilM